MILAIAAVLSLSINVFASGSVSVSAPTKVEKGESFEVKISIADNPGICSVKVRVKYDSNTFKYESYTEGGLFPTLRVTSIKTAPMLPLNLPPLATPELTETSLWR